MVIPVDPERTTTGAIVSRKSYKNTSILPFTSPDTKVSTLLWKVTYLPSGEIRGSPRDDPAEAI
jgi:hypothetical protein